MTQKVGGVEFDVVVDSSGAISASKKIVTSNERVEDSFQDIDAAAKMAGDSMVKGANKGSKASSNLSRNIGMGAVQFGQFAGQVQGGQSALLAFSQQGADIGMLFGPAGMVVGGILAVGSALAGALLPQLFKTGNQTEDLAEKLKELRKQNELTEAQTKFLAMEEAKAEEVRKESIKSTKEQIKEAESLITKFNELRATEIKAAGSTKVNATIIGGYTESIKKLRAELIELNAQLDIDTGAAKKITEEEDRKRAEFVKTQEKRIATLSMALDSESNMLSAHAQNRKNIEQSLISEQEAVAIESDIAAQNRLATKHQAIMQMLEQQKTDVLENELLTAEQKTEITAQYDEAELVAAQNHQNAMKAQAQKFSDTMVKIKEQEEAAKRSAVAGAFSSLSQLMNTESRKLFEIGKAAALANAGIAGYEAAVINYKQGSKIGGPPLGAAFAAASLAATFAQIRQIQSTQFGSAGTGQSIQGGQVVNNTQTQQTQPDRNISISLAGDSFSGSSVRGLIDAINEELGDGATLTTGG